MLTLLNAGICHAWLPATIVIVANVTSDTCYARNDRLISAEFFEMRCALLVLMLKGLQLTHKFHSSYLLGTFQVKSWSLKAVWHHCYMLSGLVLPVARLCKAAWSADVWTQSHFCSNMLQRKQCWLLFGGYVMDAHCPHSLKYSSIGQSSF